MATITFTDREYVSGPNQLSLDAGSVVRTGTLAPAPSYPAGGEPLTAANFGLSVLTHLQVDGWSRPGTRAVSWDTTGGTPAAPGKLRVWTAFGTEAVAGTDQSVNGSVNFKVIGR